MIERYSRKNKKSFSVLRHMVIKIKNPTNSCYEKYFCIVYSIYEEIDQQISHTKVLPHGNSSKRKHSYTRASQYMLNAERQLLESNKPHKVYEDLVAAADPFTTSSQSEEPQNLKEIQNGKYMIKKKPMKRLILINFLWYFCYFKGNSFPRYEFSLNSQGLSRPQNQILF